MTTTRAKRNIKLSEKAREAARELELEEHPPAKRGRGRPKKVVETVSLLALRRILALTFLLSRTSRLLHLPAL